MVGKMWVALEPERLQVDAGGDPVTVVVAVQNLGTMVDHLSLEVENLDSAWFTIAGAVLQLFPNERGQAQLRLQVPRGGNVRSGSYPFAVKVRSRTDPSEVGTAQGILEIRPYHVYRFDVMPKRALGGRGRFRAIIQNIGTADVEPQLQGKDPEALCRFNFRNDRPRVAPGADLTVPFTVSARRSSWAGEPKTFNLTVSAASDGGADVKSVSVQFVHQPTFRSWGPLVRLMVLLAFIVAVVTALIWPAWLQPQAGQTIASGWNSAQGGLCRLTNGFVPCPEPQRQVRRFFILGFERFHNAAPDVVGDPKEDEWEDSLGNHHQITNKGRLLWISSKDTYYFFTDNKVFTLTKDDKAVELKRR